MEKAYTSLAKYYDMLMQNIDYLQWFQYLDQLMSQARRPIRDVMDLACGTGNMTERLAAAGYNVHGLDLSEHMLAVARHKLPDVRFFLGDFLDWGIEYDYDAVVCVFDSLNNLLTHQELIKAFKQTLEHLRPGGVFVFDLNTPYGLDRYWGKEIKITKHGRAVAIWKSSSLRPGFSRLRITVFAKEGYRWCRVVDEVHVERGYDHRETAAMMFEAGFNTVRVYDHLSFYPASLSSTRISVVGLK